jgi:hypothetical protein
MERMTREQMVAEFGAPGVQNPAMMDLITTDPESGNVVLVMVEHRAWDASAQQLRQIEEKINRYLGYVLDGFLAEQYPQYEGRKVTIRLDCAEHPAGEAIRFLAAAKHAIEAQGLAFAIEVTGG